MDGGEVYFASAAVPDMDRYRSYIAHLNLPRNQEDTLILEVFRMMGNFVDRAFGDDPVQHVHEMRARDEKQIPPVVSSADINPKDDTSLSSAFASPAAGRERKERT